MLRLTLELEEPIPTAWETFRIESQPFASFHCGRYDKDMKKNSLWFRDWTCLNKNLLSVCSKSSVTSNHMNLNKLLNQSQLIQPDMETLSQKGESSHRFSYLFFYFIYSLDRSGKSWWDSLKKRLMMKNKRRMNREVCIYFPQLKLNIDISSVQRPQS